jgi:hypothetical protein
MPPSEPKHKIMPLWIFQSVVRDSLDSFDMYSAILSIMSSIIRSGNYRNVLLSCLVDTKEHTQGLARYANTVVDTQSEFSRLVSGRIAS